MEQTLSILKPDVVGANLAETVNTMITANNFSIVMQVKTMLSREQVEEFYAEHKSRPFFKSLIDFMTKDEVVIQILEGRDAIKRYRNLMGNTDPNKADDNTIRYFFGESVEKNAVHGSDSQESSKREIAFFYKHFSQQDDSK